MQLRNLFKFLICFLLCVLTANADYIDPAEVSVETSKYAIATPNIDKLKYTYNVSWQGLPVARAEIEVNDYLLGDETYYKVRASAKTRGAVKLFYNLKHTSESIFNPETLKPASYQLKQSENSRKKARHIHFRDDGRIYAKRWKYGELKGEHDFYTNNLTLDPISAAFMARSLPIEIGKEFDFDVFNGKHRFVITFKVEKEEMVRHKGKDKMAFRVTPSVRKLTDTKGEDKFKSATIWISTDEKRDILKIKSEVWVGSVVAVLDKYEPSPTYEKPMVPQFVSEDQPVDQAA